MPTGLSGGIAGQRRAGIVRTDPATRARRASVTLAGSLMFHALAAFLLLKIGRTTTHDVEPPREVEVSVQFPGSDTEKPQQQTAPVPPAAAEPISQPDVSHAIPDAPVPPPPEPVRPAPPVPKPATPRLRPVNRPQATARPPGTQAQGSQVPSASPALAATPAVPPGPEVTAGWRGAVSAWLQSHKTYPDEARARGEEGSALVRFTVDRSGRVLGFSLVRGTGSASLDAAVGRMLTGAQLPALPTAMTQDRTTVTVQVRYALR